MTPPEFAPLIHRRPGVPSLRRSADGTTRLYVQGKPFLMLAGELHNSSLSSSKFMSEVWDQMRANSINTLLGAVTWEDIEPQEGTFSFTELDRVLDGARAHQMHLVLLWFGTYKNGISTYAPSWVKTDTKRFPRVQILKAGGVKQSIEMVSPFSEEACAADSRAFAALMGHLADVDSQHSTVLMVQVENETGLLGDSRDRSHKANKAFLDPVPETLLRFLSANPLHTEFSSRFGQVPSSGSHSWGASIGEGNSADEAFMAYHISSYVGRVAAAGKKEYPLPLYTNTWLNFDDPKQLDHIGFPAVVGGGSDPGVYPSGGPCPHVLDIWRHNAPVLDFLAPDLYFHDYETVCRKLHATFKSTIHSRAAKRSIWRQTCLAGVRDLWCPRHSTLWNRHGCRYCRPRVQAALQTQSYLLGAAAADRFGFFFDEEPAPDRLEKWTKVIGDYEVIVERCFVFGKPGPGAGMVIHQGSGKFLCVGRGFHVYFGSVHKEATFTGILHAVEREVAPDGITADPTSPQRRRDTKRRVPDDAKRRP